LLAKALSSGSDHDVWLLLGVLDEDVVVIEATPAPAPPVPASEEINVTSTDSEVEIVTVGDGFRYVLAQRGDST
jgi:E3 ubiquitin-protein ligase Arkadia